MLPDRNEVHAPRIPGESSSDWAGDMRDVFKVLGVGESGMRGMRGGGGGAEAACKKCRPGLTRDNLPPEPLLAPPPPSPLPCSRYWPSFRTTHNVP